MSLFTKIFGSGKSSEKTPTPQEAIQKLLEIEDLLRKRQEVLEKKIEDELKVAKANGVKNKRCTFTIDLIAFLFFIGMKVKIKILFGFFSGITSIEAKETL